MHIHKRCSAILILLCLALTAASCTTSTYGQGLQPVPNSKNEYLLKVYIGGFSGGATADKSAAAEIEKFMRAHDFASYEIVSRRHNLVPSYFEYRVRFEDRPISQSDQ